GQAGAGRPGAAAAWRAVRRPGPAGRDRPGAGHPARGDLRRRADRVAGLTRRPAGHAAADRRGAVAGRHGGAGHSRGPGGRVLRARGHGPRRPGDLAGGHAMTGSGGDTMSGPRGRARWARQVALAARLALAGRRESAARLVITAVGIGLGVVMLLFGAVALPALHAHAAPHGWPKTSAPDTAPA